MEQDEEDLIWDTIMESGQSRVDYAAFSAFFPFKPDNFLSAIIYGFAINRNIDAIAANINSQVAMTGNSLDLPALTRFIEASREALATEIAATVMALQKLGQGHDPADVLRQAVALMQR